MPGKPKDEVYEFQYFTLKEESVKDIEFYFSEKSIESILKQKKVINGVEKKANTILFQPALANQNAPEDLDKLTISFIAIAGFIDTSKTEKFTDNYYVAVPCPPHCAGGND